MAAHEVTAITTMTLVRLAPRIEARAIASASQGITRNQLVNAFKTVSIFVPPK